MPGFLLHVGATVVCAHAGQAQSPTPDPRVLVSGMPVTTAEVPYLIAACTFPAMTSGLQPPCVTATWVSAATRVLAHGMPVLLIDSQAVCVPTGTPLLPLVAQTRVTGM